MQIMYEFNDYVNGKRVYINLNIKSQMVKFEYFKAFFRNSLIKF